MIPDFNKVMSCLEGLAQDDWREFYSDSEVRNTAKAAIKLLKDQADEYDFLLKLFFILHDKLLERPEIIRCRDCKYWDSTPQNTTTFWKPCDEIKTEPYYYCWCGTK